MATAIMSDGQVYNFPVSILFQDIQLLKSIDFSPRIQQNKTADIFFRHIVGVRPAADSKEAATHFQSRGE